MIIITPLLQPGWNDLGCPSLGAAPPLPLHQPEGTNSPHRGRLMDGPQFGFVRVQYASARVSGSDSEAGGNLDP